MKLSFKVKVPKGVNPAYLRREIGLEIKVAVLEAEWKVEKFYARENILSNDTAFNKRYEWQPIVRASTYKTLKSEQDIMTRGWDFDQAKHPGRPVVMRTAAHFLAEQFHGDNYERHAWARAVCLRYLKRIRYSSGDNAAHRRFLVKLEQRVLQKPWNAQKRFELTLAGGECVHGFEWPWLDGRRIDLPTAKDEVIKEVTKKSAQTRFATRSRKERTALRAAMELGLITTGDVT